MSTDEPVFEFKEVRAIRGLVEKTRTKWEKEGWEFVSQADGKLQTTLNFRRPKPKFPVKWAIVGGGVAVLLVAVIVIGSISEANNKNTQTAAPAATSSTSTKSPSTPGASASAEEILTVQNNADLAQLLSSTATDPAAWQQFYDKYKGRTMEFDGNVGFMQDVPNTKYTVDMLIYAGDFSETSAVGPPFKAGGINIHSGFPMSKDSERSRLFQGDNIHVVARVSDYNPKQELFQLTLISTSIR